MADNLDIEEKITVVVPVYNREHLIARCLDSIVAQSWNNIEILVVDNGSKDSTVKTIEDYMARIQETFKGKTNSKSLRLLHEYRKGACAARNKGLKEAKGKYVIFFDSDDTMRPSLIESAMRVINKSHTTDIVCWKCCIHMLNGSERVPAFIPNRPLEGHIIHTLLRPQGCMMRTSLAIEAGGWNEELPGWNDWEFGLRLLLKNPKIKYVDKILADIYAQENSITGKNFYHKKGVWEKSLSSGADATIKSGHVNAALILNLIKYREIILAAHYSKEGHPEAAQTLMETAMKKTGVISRLLLLFAYHYTRFGFRGAWTLIRPFYIRSLLTSSH